MIDFHNNTKYKIFHTSDFKKDYKKVKKQGKDIEKLKDIIEKLANGEDLPSYNHNHALYDNRKYKGCGECHIEPDWLLVYKYQNDKLILLLVATGSHSNLF